MRGHAAAGTQGCVPLQGMVGYDTTVWVLLPNYPPKITEHGIAGGPTYPPRITEHAMTRMPGISGITAGIR